MGEKSKKPKKTKSLSFRIPEELRLAIIEAAEELGLSQSDFMIGGAWGLLRQISEGATFKDLLLPDGYKLPYQPDEKARMVTIRAAPETLRPLQHNAPRLWHSTTRLILWGSALRLHRSTKVALPMNVEAAPQEQTPTVQFRVPFAVRQAVEALTCNIPNTSLPSFIATATEHFLKRLDKTPAKNLLLPKGFSVPTSAAVVTTPIQNDRVLHGIYETAPQMYHTVGRIMLLATAWKALPK